MEKQPQESQEKHPNARPHMPKMLWIKLLVIAILAGGIIYLIYYAALYGKVQVILSPSDIMSASQESVSHYKKNSKVYFYVYRNNTDLDSGQVTVEIEYNNGTTYRHHKQMSLETDKSYQKISSYLPAEYFSQSGKYRVNVLMDGKKVSAQDVEITD